MTDPKRVDFPPDFTAVEACLLPEQKQENGPCSDKFSNPKFFENQWIAEQEQRIALLKEERKKRKEERKARKAEEKKTGQKKKKLQGSGSKLNWREAAKQKVGDDIQFETRSECLALPRLPGACSRSRPLWLVFLRFPLCLWAPRRLVTPAPRPPSLPRLQLAGRRAPWPGSCQ